MECTIPNYTPDNPNRGVKREHLHYNTALIAHTLLTPLILTLQCVEQFTMFHVFYY